MLEDVYDNNSYEVLRRSAEDRSAWRESTRKKVPKITKEEQVSNGKQTGKSSY